jgi:uncharacterized protein with ATP-grasp and redox domains
LRVAIDCVPCVFKQALSASRRCTSDVEELRRVQYELMKRVPEWSFDQSPAEFSYYAIRVVNEVLGCADPFAEDKHQSNTAMLELYPHLKEIVESSPDKLHTAIKIAAAGNVIDMGILHRFDVREAIDDVLTRSFQIDHFDQLKQDLMSAEKLLYIADNAGEIVADMLFLETLGRKDAVVAVKEGPILNDATMEDAMQVCLDGVAIPMSNGSDMIGTVLDDCSEEFRNVFHAADVIISKGQGNYEGLDERPENIYFVLTAKCRVVAEALGVEEGDAVLKKERVDHGE